jgi:hypothetical protein
MSRGSAPALSFEALRLLALGAGFNSVQADIAAAVALAESAGYPEARGDGGASFGLWQVHTPSHPEYTPALLLEPAYNAKAAWEIFSKGGWAMWTTYRTGAYRQYMPKGTTP